MGNSCSSIDEIRHPTSTNNVYKYVDVENNNVLMETKLKNVCIKTSHNSYIESTQHFSFSSINAIETCIDNGVRAIELDIFASNPFAENWNPVISHGIEGNNGKFNIYTCTCIDFRETIEKIATKAFIDTTDPFFIVIENNATRAPITNDIVADVLQSIWQDRLFVKPVEYETIFDCPIRLLINKVIIITDIAIGKFQNIVNASWHDKYVKNTSSNDNSNKDDTLFWRIYPGENIYSTVSLNYDPTIFYNKKANMIAMNFQTSDAHLLKYNKIFIDDIAKTKTRIKCFDIHCKNIENKIES